MEENFKQDVIDRIKALNVPNDLKNIQIGAIPLSKGVILSKVRAGERKTESGIVLPEIKSTWQQIGRIVALGPYCSEFLKVGLLVTYNAMADIETIIQGKSYIITNEVSIEVIIEDEQNVQVLPKVPTSETLDREERIAQFNSGSSKIKKQGENKLDASYEKAKDLRKNPITSKYKK